MISFISVVAKKRPGHAWRPWPNALKLSISIRNPSSQNQKANTYRKVSDVVTVAKFLDFRTASKSFVLPPLSLESSSSIGISVLASPPDMSSLTRENRNASKVADDSGYARHGRISNVH